MKIGIIVHSQTGNTFSVAERIREKLLKAGHSVNLERIIAVKDDEPDIRKIQLQNKPDLSAYEAIILGAPVRAFSLSLVMSAYLSQIPAMNGKKIACFMTQQLPYPWMGGKRALRQITELCTSKGAQITGTGIINWSHKLRQNRIEALVEDFYALF